jgi:hypothetical protein
MAIVLEAHYAKKLGLPNFSSHQYAVTIRTELTDLSQVEAESARLYRTLQDAVDREIQEVGFMPDATRYGMNNGNGHVGSAPDGNGRARNGHGNPTNPSENAPDGGNGGNGGDRWRCSDKQREFIERIVREKGLDKNEVERLAVEMFAAGVKQLDRLQASGLIDELLERHGDGRRNGKQRYRRERFPAGGGGGQ